jgi:hypothetical protein
MSSRPGKHRDNLIKRNKTCTKDNTEAEVAIHVFPDGFEIYKFPDFLEPAEPHASPVFNQDDTEPGQDDGIYQDFRNRHPFINFAKHTATSFEPETT